ncbi:MAG: hypothetical protein LJE70_10880 [Chromatiaceae bacterium]|nr:hypothetical protein [Chromatiaceae bacterium]
MEILSFRHGYAKGRRTMLQEVRARFSPTGDAGFRVQLTDRLGIAQGVECDFTPFLTDDD